MEIITEDVYDFLVNDEEEIMLVMNSYEGEPSKSRLIFDGQSVAILYRSPEHAIRLSELPVDIVDYLGSVTEILVCEMTEEGDFGHTYSAQVVGTGKGKAN